MPVINFNNHITVLFLIFFIRHRVVDCTRWAELTDTLRFHINLANKAQAPTEFRMLNGIVTL
jgi:hypothetical protein